MCITYNPSCKSPLAYTRCHSLREGYPLDATRDEEEMVKERDNG